MEDVPITISFLASGASSGEEIGFDIPSLLVMLSRVYMEGVIGSAGGLRWISGRPGLLHLFWVWHLMKVQRVAFTELGMLGGRGGSSGLLDRASIWSMILRSKRLHRGSCSSSSSVNWMLKTSPASNIFWANGPKLPAAMFNRGSSIKCSIEGGDWSTWWK